MSANQVKTVDATSSTSSRSLARLGGPSQSGQKGAKSRTGCEQCKKRKVKCDEKRPTCSRCLNRGETCTGNFAWDLFQIERPYLVATTPSVLENDTLRYWYGRTCLVMALFRPPVNPLSYSMVVLLRHSKALRHTLESVASAHRGSFSHDCVSEALQSRGLAIVSLQREVNRLVACEQQDYYYLTRTVLLSSLLLHVSTPWLDATGKDSGAVFLSGIHNLVHKLADEDSDDEYAFYALGLFLYCEAFSSHLDSDSQRSCLHEPVLRKLLQPPFSLHIHPVTGLTSTICPFIRDAGRMYRRVVDSGHFDIESHLELESQLRSWEPPAGCPKPPQLLEMSDAYRSVGLIMIYQARAVVSDISAVDMVALLQNVKVVMKTLKHVPKNDPLVNWVGPMVVIAGSEIPSDWQDEREMALRCSRHLADWTRAPTYHSMIPLIKETWRQRDAGSRITWLELMTRDGHSLVFG